MEQRSCLRDYNDIQVTHLMNEFSWTSVCALMSHHKKTPGGVFFISFSSVGWFDWKVLIFALKFFILNEKGFDLNVIQYVIVRYTF